MKKYKDLFLCANIIIVTIILFFVFLIYNKVGGSQDSYFFTRKYSEIGSSWSLQRVTRPDSLDMMQACATRMIDSVELYNHNLLAFEPNDTSSTASFNFFHYMFSDNGQKRIRIESNIPTCTYSNVYEKRLAYSGVFLMKDNFITYTFNHLPIVSVFDKEGKFITSIHTKDNVPCPSIIRYKQFYIYERGHAFNSNISSFVDGKYVYVFSYRVPKIAAEFIADVYSLVTGKYQFSIRIANDGNCANTDIDRIYTDGNDIYIDTRTILFKLNILTARKQLN